MSKRVIKLISALNLELLLLSSQNTPWGKNLGVHIGESGLTRTWGHLDGCWDINSVKVLKVTDLLFRVRTILWWGAEGEPNVLVCSSFSKDKINVEATITLGVSSTLIAKRSFSLFLKSFYNHRDLIPFGRNLYWVFEEVIRMESQFNMFFYW